MHFVGCGGTERKLEQSKLNSMNRESPTSVPSFGLPDPGLNISIKQFLCKVQKMVLAK